MPDWGRGKIYDDITAHGTNAVPEEQAMPEAIERYEKDHPTTRPATKPAARAETH